MTGKSIKDVSPRWLKDVANRTTRSYGLLTADLRPLPDYLLVGTKRGGTTTLWNALLEHPQVLGMFPQTRGLKSNAWFFEQRQSERWYRSHFPTRAYRAVAEQRVGLTVVGEASPYYMYGPHIAARIALALPQVKIVVLLRNPVDRAYSHYQERRKQGVEMLSFEEALVAETGRLASDAERRDQDPFYYSEAHDFFSYRDRGIYLPQIQRLQRCFPETQIIIRLSESFYREPETVLNDIARFLGIASWPTRPVNHHNRIPRSPMAESVRAELEDFYRPWNERLAAHLDMDLGW